MPRNLVLFDLEWNIGYKPYIFNYHGVQQTFRGEIIEIGAVKIDEDGVEAAAYTEIVANDSAMMETPPTVEMELDRPFLFVIFDYNNVPLFVGTVNTVA